MNHKMIGYVIIPKVSYENVFYLLMEQNCSNQCIDLNQPQNSVFASNFKHAGVICEAIYLKSRVGSKNF